VTPPLIIAVDGPAASGKGTISTRLSKIYGLPLLDTGLLYRAVGARMRAEGHGLDDAVQAGLIARNFDPAWLSEPGLRQREAAEAASIVARMPEVRAALLAFQRDFACQPAGAVLDGRDIGSVIAPQAQAKLWIDAALSARAIRRFRELTGRGEIVTAAEIEADLRARDARDAPNMQIAPDAVKIDTTFLDIHSSVEAALAAIKARIGY
jgi:CMP/dCMP kinase